MISSPTGWSKSNKCAKRRRPQSCLPPFRRPRCLPPEAAAGPNRPGSAPGVGSCAGVAPGATCSIDAPCCPAARRAGELRAVAVPRRRVRRRSRRVRPGPAPGWQRVPFELRVDLFTQARYSNFAQSKDEVGRQHRRATADPELQFRGGHPKLRPVLRLRDSILGFSSRRFSSPRRRSMTRFTWDGSTTGSAMPST